MGAATVVGAIALNLGINKSGFQKDLGGITKLAQAAGKAIAAAFSVKAITSFVSSCVSLGSDLAEVQNVVDVTFGNMAGAADEWAESAITAFGMSEKVAKQYLGTTGAMAKAFGFSTKEALEQAKGVAGLAGDVASFYNLSTDEAYSKLKAIYTGETEGLKALGVVMTQSALDQFALAKGYGKTTAKMSEQEKVALRYAFVMDKLSAAQGDFTRTQDGWANQTRVLKLRFDALKATLGQGFINILTPVVKWLNSLLEKLMLYAEVFKQFTAQVFGDAGNAGSAGSKAFSSAAESTDEATEAAKKYKKAVMGFDELNILSTGDSSEDEASSFVSGFDDAGAASEKSMSETERKAAAIVERLKEILGINGKITSWADFFNTKIGKIVKKVGRFALVLAGWKIGKSVMKFFAGTDWATIAGDIAGIAGSFLAIDGVSSMFEDGISWANALETVAGGALLGFKIGGLKGALIGGIVGAVAVGIAAIWQYRDEIGKALGSAWEWVKKAFSNAVDWVSQAFSDAVNWIKTAWSDIGNFFKGIWEAIVGFFVGIWQGVVSVWSGVAGWFDENVIQPVVKIFGGLFMRIGQFAEGCWIIIQAVWKIVSEWFNDNIIKPVASAFKWLWEHISALFSTLWGYIKSVWKVVADWFSENIIKPVANLFKSLWSSITAIWSKVANWFNTRVIQPIVGFFTAAWDKIVSAFKAAFEAIGHFAKSIFNGIIGFVEGIINKIISAINWLISGFNGVVSWAAGVIGADWSGVTPLSPVTLPRLAQGGFVKANTPQLAVIGDNRHEGEIVAPESKIAEAVMRGIQAVGGLGIKDEIYRAVYDAIIQAMGQIRIEPDFTVMIGNEKLDDYIVKAIKKRTVRSGA